MRFVITGGILQWTVDEFLQNQMTARVPAQVGTKEQPAKILQVAMQVAGCQNFGGIIQTDRLAPAARGIAASLEGPAERDEQAVRVGHVVRAWLVKKRRPGDGLIDFCSQPPQTETVYHLPSLWVPLPL